MSKMISPGVPQACLLTLVLFTRQPLHARVILFLPGRRAGSVVGDMFNLGLGAHAHPTLSIRGGRYLLG